MGKNAVVAFAFGTPATTPSNVHIARMASSLGRLLALPIYTQSEEYLHFDPACRVERIAEEPGEPAPTLRIARGAVAWAKKNGITVLWIACAKPHLWRCRRDLAKAIAEAGGGIFTVDCDDAWMTPWNIWFSPQSTQERTRSPASWLKREIILWLMPFFLYKRIAA